MTMRVCKICGKAHIPADYGRKRRAAASAEKEER